MPEDDIVARDDLALWANLTDASGDPNDWRIPSGRHGLPRELVVSYQRLRILRAVVSVVASGGYGGYTVQRVLKRAGVSRGTFYNLFHDRDEAFLEMYDLTSNCLLARTEAAWSEAGAGVDPTEQLGRCLRALLESVAGEPELARVCFVEALVAGPVAMEHRERHLKRFAEPLTRAITEHSGIAPEPLMVDALAGAIYELIYSRVAQGRTAEVPDLFDVLYSFGLMLFRYAPLDHVPSQE